MMRPTAFSSRLNASPRTPVRVNSTSSPAMTLARPYTRAMPSPTSSTRPTSVACRRLLNWLISLERTETISSALNLMGASFQELVRELVEAGLYGGVQIPSADAGGDPPAQGPGGGPRPGRGPLVRGTGFRPV